MHTAAVLAAHQQTQTGIDRLRERVESAGLTDHCGVLAGRAADAPVGVVMCLADQCGADYSELFSDR